MKKRFTEEQIIGFLKQADGGGRRAATAQLDGRSDAGGVRVEPSGKLAQ